MKLFATLITDVSSSEDSSDDSTSSESSSEDDRPGHKRRSRKLGKPGKGRKKGKSKLNGSDSESSSGTTLYDDISVYSSSEDTEYDESGNVSKPRKERVRKVIRQKFKAKVVYASSEATVYDSDGNVAVEHKPRTKTVVQQM